MTNPELNTLETLREAAERAELIDTRLWADKIIQQLGVEHNVDGGTFTEAVWSSEATGKGYELACEHTPDGYPIYWLSVIGGINGESVEHYGFDIDLVDISLVTGDDQEEMIYDYDEDPEVCWELEAELKNHLRTAPLHPESVPIADTWGSLFTSMMKELAKQDEILQAVKETLPKDFLFYDSLSDEQKDKYHAIIKFIKKKYALSNVQVYEVVDFYPPLYATEEGQNGQA